MQEHVKANIQILKEVIIRLFFKSVTAKLLCHMSNNAFKITCFSYLTVGMLKHHILVEKIDHITYSSEAWY